MTTPGNNTPEKIAQGFATDARSQHVATDTSTRADKIFEQRARELFREAGDRIDHVTAGRLRAARRAALDASRSPQHHTARWLIPAGAFAAIALATLMVWQPLSPNAVPPTPSADTAVQTVETDNDLPPDADKTDPNLYQNMDFYKWLAANNAPDDAAGGQPVNR